MAKDGALCMYVTLSMEWAGPGKRNPKLLNKLTQDKDSIWERLLFPYFGGMSSRRTNYEASAMAQCIIFA